MIVALSVAACSSKNQDVIFKGKSENWETTLTFTPRASGASGMAKHFIIRYIGNDPQKNREIKYQFANNNQVSTQGTDTVNGNNETNGGASCSYCSFDSLQDDKWELIITWDNQTEKIEMPIQK